jgi:hypothetical protein
MLLDLELSVTSNQETMPSLCLQQTASILVLELLNQSRACKLGFYQRFHLKVLKIGKSSETMHASKLSSTTLEELEIKLIRPKQKLQLGFTFGEE